MMAVYCDLDGDGDTIGVQRNTNVDHIADGMKTELYSVHSG